MSVRVRASAVTRLLRVAAVLLDVAGCTVLRGACALVAIDTADELRAAVRRAV